jgi:hypothetical protein
VRHYIRTPLLVFAAIALLLGVQLLVPGRGVDPPHRWPSRAWACTRMGFACDTATPGPGALPTDTPIPTSTMAGP